MTNSEPSRDHEPVYTYLREVPPIEAYSSETIRSYQDIDNMIEYPLRAACRIFYAKNIPTTFSSANTKDTNEGLKAYINFDYANLSTENQAILKELSGNESGHLSYPVNHKTTVAEVEAYFLQAAQTMKWQPFKAHKYTLDDLTNIYGANPNGQPWQPSDFPNYYYDPESELFYPDEHDYRKEQEPPPTD